MSLNSSDNECSEVIDNNYSFRSVSEESLSCDDEEESLARELMIKMTPAVLSKLRRSFKKNRDKSHGNNIDRKVEQVMRAAAAQEGIEFAAPSSSPEHSLCLDEEGFVSALDNIFGHHKFTTHAHKLFKLLDPFCSGRVWWRQLINRLVAVGAKRTSSRADLWKPLREGMMKRLEHCKRETIVKLVSVEKEDSFCYVAVSKGGRVGIYSGELQLLASYEVFYHRTGIRRRVKNSWITDVIYLGNVKCLILAASDRSLTVYDATTLTHTPIFCITGIPNIPMCLAYTPMSPFGNTSELALGTERGDLIRIRFLQPRISLFYSKTPENINYYFWTELSSAPHTTYCAVTTWRSVHSRTIRRVAYTRDGDILLSCSHDSMVSVRSRHVPGKLNDYVFKLQRGVTCFHVISPLHLLATGSCDGVVRLWETTQSTPFATLAAPTTPAVLDVVVVAAEEIVLAYCNNCTIHIWDMYEECLLQSIKLKYPFLGILGKRVEFGTYCIHPGPARKSLSDNDTPSDPPIEAFSRRGSSVYQGSSGGLILQTEPKDDWQTRGLEQEPEYIRFNRPELMFTCCDYISVLKLKDTELGDLLPPPGDTLRARRPSIWELPEDVMMAPLSSRTSPRSPRAPSPSPSPGHLLTPSTAEFPTHDLDTLLKNAGLEGILEKDFVLMQGLKQDLNRKLADMKANMSEMSAAVNAGAPYLALKTFEPVPMEPVDEMMDAYKRVMKCEHSCNSDGKRIFNTQEKFKVMTNLAYKVGKQVISLAEGMPNEGVFPFSKIDIEMKGGGRLFMEGKDLSAALQYIPSQGLPSLLTELRQFQDYMHRPPPLPRDVMVTNGGQHGIYQCVDLLMETGDPIIVNEYAYTGAHSSLKPYQPEIIGIPEDEFGLIPETLELVLSDRLACGMKMPKVLYLIPTGSNPSGTVLPEERRRRIYEMACRYDFLIIEDDPYVFLNYSDKNVPSFLSLDTCGRVIRLDSLSKVVSSGLRAGWVTAPLPVLQKLELHMQAELLHSCTLSQVILLHMISHREALASHLKAARDLYRNRRDALNYALRGVTDLAEWTVPEAGLFFWVRVRGIEDVYNMVFRTAFNRGLMVVPGQAFSFDTTAPCQYLRLTFSKVRYEDMDRAAHHLAEIIKEEQQLTLQKQPQRLATER